MTRIFGVIGSPIAHSLSPAMQTAALNALRLDAVYSAFEVPPQFLKPVLKALVLAGVEGLNVTVPLKEAVIPLLDRLDPAARAIGAVNTIRIRNRKLTGCNTDAAGFAAALKEMGWRFKPSRVVILGAGGAAKAVAWQLSQTRGTQLTIANRHLKRAQQLSRWLSKKTQARVKAVSFRAVDLSGVDLLVNATSLGMKAHDPSPIALDGLSRRTMVYDLVYHRQTKLVLKARQRGCVAAGGLSMLLYQGAASLRLWTKHRPPVAVMRRALICALDAKPREKH